MQIGEPLRLNCSITSSEPPVTIRWMIRLEDGSVEFVRENRTRATDDDGEFSFEEVGKTESNPAMIMMKLNNKNSNINLYPCSKMARLEYRDVIVFLNEYPGQSLTHPDCVNDDSNVF